jgi:hypothetical protein
MLTIPVRVFARIDPAGYLLEEKKRGAGLLLVERSGEVERRLITDDRPNLWRRIAALGQGAMGYNQHELERFVQEFGLPLVTRIDKRGRATLDLGEGLLPIIHTFGRLFFEWGVMGSGAKGQDWDPLIRQVQKNIQWCQVHVRYDFARGHERPLLFFEPENLVSAAWIEFLGSVAGTERFGLCSHCLTPFSLEKKGAKRATRRFCSTRCRTAAHRSRIQELDAGPN